MKRPTPALALTAFLAIAIAAIASAAFAQPDSRRDRSLYRELSPDLNLSVGLGCIVYLRTPPEGNSGITSNAYGMGKDRSRPVVLEGTLTAVSPVAITLRSNDRVYWINLDTVTVLEFQSK